MMKKQIHRRSFIQSTGAAALAFPSLVSTAATQPQGKLAVLGGDPVRKQPFPRWPIIASNDEESILDALRRKEWCRLYGNLTTTFEKSWAEKLGIKHALGLTSGTGSLYGGLHAVGIEPGDEVILSPYTFIATLNVVIQHYALPVFSDTDLETYQMDAKSLESRINENTRCILPVHLGGNVADMGEIMAVAKKHNLAVVEDACQSHCAEWGGKKAGCIGDVGCFSFQATKILACGEGGAAVTDSDAIYDKLHAFHNNGRDRVTGTKDGYIHQGTNLRMTELQAALLNAQLTRFDEQVKKRIENADYFSQLLKDVPGIKPAKKSPGATRSTYYLYMVDYDKEAFGGLSKNQFIKAINEEGIPCGGGYKPLNKEPFLKTLIDSKVYKKIYPEQQLKTWRERNECPQNDKVCERGIFFSQEVLLGSKQDIDQIIEAMMKVHANKDALLKG